MSEFNRFVTIIEKLVRKVIQRTIDLLIIVLFIFSGILPWRFYEIRIQYLEEFGNNTESNQTEWRLFVLENFALTVLDFVCVPMGIISCISCLRKDVWVDFWNKSEFSKRLVAVSAFIYFIADTISFPFAIMTIISPLRLLHFYEELKASHILHANKWAIFLGVLSIIDILTFFVSLLICVSPIRLFQLRASIKYIFLLEVSDRIDDELIVNKILISTAMSAVLDMFVIPFLCILLLFWFRLGVVSNEITFVLNKIVSTPIKDDLFQASDRNINYVIFIHGIGSIFDLLCFLLSFLCNIFIPSCWNGYFLGTNDLIVKYYSIADELPQGGDRNFVVAKRQVTLWNYFSSINYHLLIMIPRSFLDIIAAVCGVFAIISPIRHTSFLTSMKVYYAIPSQEEVVGEGEKEGGGVVSSTPVQEPNCMEGGVLTTPSHVVHGFSIKNSDRFEFEGMNPNAVVNNLKVANVQDDSLYRSDAAIDSINEIHSGDEEVTAEESQSNDWYKSPTFQLHDDKNEADSTNRVVAPEAVKLDMNETMYRNELQIISHEKTIPLEALSTTGKSGNTLPLVHSSRATTAVRRELARAEEEYLLAQTRYHWDLRQHCYYYGCLAIADILMLPFLLPLWITWYRFKPVLAFLRNSHEWSVKEYSIIIQQFLLLLVDALFLGPAVLLLGVTRVRLLPVSEAMTGNYLQSTSLSLTLYSTALTACLLLSLDILLLPMTCLVFLTHYRWEVAGAVWRSKSLWHNRLTFHMVVIYSAMIVLFDLLLLSPALMLTMVLAPWRIIPLLAVTQRIGTPSCCRSLTSRNSSDDSPTPPAAATPIYERYEDLPVLPVWTWRRELLDNIIGSIFDLPFFPIAVLVFLSIWRTSALWTSLKKALVIRSTRDTLFLREWRARMTVMQQLLLLLRDLFCLVPFAIIAVTVARLPTLLMDLYARLNTKPLKDEALLTVHECELVGKGPTLRLICSLIKNTNTEEENISQYGSINQRSVRVRDLGVCKDRPAKLYFLAPDLWDKVKLLLGSGIASMGRALLPISLPVDKQIIITELNTGPQLKQHQQEQEQVLPETSDYFSIELRLGFGLKRAISSLSLFPVDALLAIQVEADILCEPPQGGKPERKHVVLLRITPTTGELVRCLKKSTPVLAEDGLDQRSSRWILMQTLNSDTEQQDTESEGIVESFYLIVCMAFLQLLLDLFYTILACLTLLVPWRGVQLAVALTEKASYFPFRLAEKCQSMSVHADELILKFRSKISVLLNTYLKNDGLSNRRNRRYFSPDAELRREVDELQRSFLDPYRRLCGNIKLVATISDECKPIHSMFMERFRLHDVLAYHWLFRVAMYLEFREESFEEDLLGVMLACVDQSHFGVAAALNKNSKLIASAITAMKDKAEGKRGKDKDIGVSQLNIENITTTNNLSNTTSIIKDNNDNNSNNNNKNDNNYNNNNSNYNHSNNNNNNNDNNNNNNSNNSNRKQRSRGSWSCAGLLRCGGGLFHRPLDSTRMIIAGIAVQAVADVAFLLLFFFLLVTVVRALPLFRDLYESNSFSPTRYTTRQILKSHCLRLLYDIYLTMLLVGYSLLIVLLVVGIPSYLSDLPSNVDSLQVAIKCARRHLNNSFMYIFELLSLVFVFRTYRIIIRASFYGLLVPAACLAEAIPKAIHIESTMKFFIGILLWVVMLAGSILTILNAQGLGSQLHPGEAVSSTPPTSPGVNSALLGLSVGLFGILSVIFLSVSRRREYVLPLASSVTRESLTWSHVLAVLVSPMETAQLAAVVLYFFWSNDSSRITGNDIYASWLFRWQSNDSTSQNNSFEVSLDIAVVAIFLWGVLISLPLALHSSDSGRRHRKMLTLKESPLYEFLCVSISRLFTVWIMITLMRPVSCVLEDATDSSSSSSSYSYILSTDSRVMCGGGRRVWSSVLSSSLLVYFMVTSSILHSDDAELLVEAGESEHCSGGVRFSPLYALGVRMGQYLICAICASQFLADNTFIPLAFILLICVATALLPLSFANSVCSYAVTVPLRSAGFLCVAWLVVLCMFRNGTSSHNPLSHWVDEAVLFIGWGVLAAIGIGLAFLMRRWEYDRWQGELVRSGLNEAINKALSMADTLLVEELFSGKKELVKHRISKCRAEVTQAMSFSQLAFSVVSLEESIVADRLSLAFLRNRNNWKKLLLTAVETAHPQLPSENDVESFPSNSNARSQLVILQAIETLSTSLRPCANSLEVSRSLLSILLKRKIPDDMCWEIYSFCFDVSVVREILRKLLVEKSKIAVEKDMLAFTKRDLLSYLKNRFKDIMDILPQVKNDLEKLQL